MYGLDSKEEDPLSKFDSLFDEPMVNMEKKPKYIEPDTIKAPKIFYDVTFERPRPPSAKKYFASSSSSVVTDMDFDYGAAIGFQPEEWPYSNK